MSDQKHTQEPWRTDAENGFLLDVHGANGTLVARCHEEDDAIRIKACVNACAGIPTADLELCPHGGMFHLAAHANQLVEQRDKLLAALGALTDAAGQWTCHSEALRLTHFQARVVMNSVKVGAA